VFINFISVKKIALIYFPPTGHMMLAVGKGAVVRFVESAYEALQ
jgi:hypothetical protein